MIDIYNKIKVGGQKRQFSMPLSLRYIKELSAAKIDYKGLHIIDLTSLVYSLRIDSAMQYLENERQSKMSKRGIAEYRQATEADFNRIVGVIMARKTNTDFSTTSWGFLGKFIQDVQTESRRCAQRGFRGSNRLFG